MRTASSRTGHHQARGVSPVTRDDARLSPQVHQGDDRHNRAYFTEEIEGLLQETLNTQLAATDAEEIGANVSLSNTPTGKLEIWWDEARYTDIDTLPNADLRQALHTAIRR